MCTKFVGSVMWYGSKTWYLNQEEERDFILDKQGYDDDSLWSELDGPKIPRI